MTHIESPSTAKFDSSFPPPKKPYETPTLKVYGTVEKITGCIVMPVYHP